MGGRVAVHVTGLVAGDMLAYTISFGPDHLPITSAIVVDLRRLFVSVSPSLLFSIFLIDCIVQIGLRTVRLDRTTGEEWTAGEDDEFLDDDSRLARRLLNVSKVSLIYRNPHPGWDDTVAQSPLAI